MKRLIAACAMGAALTATLRRGGLLLAILVLPMMIPTLIFGVAAAAALADPLASFATPFLLLCAVVIPLTSCTTLSNRRDLYGPSEDAGPYNSLQPKKANAPGANPARDGFDRSLDGQRFLVARSPIEARRQASIHLVENWLAVYGGAR